MTDIVNLNVGGWQYSVAKSTIMKFEDTMLAKLVSEKWNPKNSKAAIFVDRDGERFKYILDFYRDGEIIVPNNIAIDTIKNDSLFFGLPEYMSIKKESLFLKDIFSLWTTFKTLKTQQSEDSAALQMQQWYDSAALWAVEKLFSVVNYSKNKLYVRMGDYPKPPSCGGHYENTKLIAAIKNIILSLEGDTFLASSTTINLHGNDYLVFTFNV